MPSSLGIFALCILEVQHIQTISTQTMNDGKTIKENNNQSASNELKIATNSTSCHIKTNGTEPIEWSIAKEEKNVCQSEKTIGIIQEDNGKYYLFYDNQKQELQVDDKVFINITEYINPTKGLKISQIKSTASLYNSNQNSIEPDYGYYETDNLTHIEKVDLIILSK